MVRLDVMRSVGLRILNEEFDGCFARKWLLSFHAVLLFPRDLSRLFLVLYTDKAVAPLSLVLDSREKERIGSSVNRRRRLSSISSSSPKVIHFGLDFRIEEGRREVEEVLTWRFHPQQAGIRYSPYFYAKESATPPFACRDDDGDDDSDYVTFRCQCESACIASFQIDFLTSSLLWHWPLERVDLILGFKSWDISYASYFFQPHLICSSPS